MTILDDQVQVLFSCDGETWRKLPAYVESVRVVNTEDTAFLEIDPASGRQVPLSTHCTSRMTIELIGDRDLQPFADGSYWHAVGCGAGKAKADE